MNTGTVAMSGGVSNKVISGNVKAPWQWKVRNAARLGFIQGYVGVRVAKLLPKVFPITTMTSELRLKSYHADAHQWIDYGTVGYKVVTNLGAELIVDAFQNTFELETFIQHGTGSGSAAEAGADTDLETPHTTVLNPDNVRGVGTTTEGSAPSIWETVATNTYDAAAIVREHGIFNQTDPSGGSLFDRTIFAEINLGNGDSLQSTYDLTVNAGG